MQGYGRRTAMALTIGLTALAAPSVASAQAVPDASCPGPDNQQATTSGDARTAQTFTAQNSGLLTRAQILANKSGSAGDWVVSINAVDGSGAPTNTVLASATIPDASVPDGETTLTADFASPAAVTAGQQYAVVMSRPDSDSLGILWRDDNPCPGVNYDSASQTDPFADFCAGACDLIFAVFVEPTAPPPEDVPAPKADRTLILDVNKGKVEKGKKVRASGQLEAAGNDAACEASQTIEVLRDGLKRGAPQVVATLTTDAQGNYSTKLKMRKTSLLTARAPETQACEQETSDTEKVRVQKPKAAKQA